MLVTEVLPGSEAEEKSVKPGDVIVQVSQREVSDPDDVAERVEQLKSEGRRTVMFLVSGAENKLRFVSLRFDDAQQGSAALRAGPAWRRRIPRADSPAGRAAR